MKFYLRRHWLGIGLLLASILGLLLMPTIASALRNDARPTNWTGVVTSINYATRTLTANLQGDSGPERIRIPDTFDFGTKDNPKLGVGSLITVQRIGNEYYATLPLAKQGGAFTNYLPLVAAQLDAPIAQPQWLAGFPHIAGTQLEGAWRGDARPGIEYELYYNSVPSLNGAQLHPLSPIAGTSFSTNWNRGVTSNLIQNGSLESGFFGFVTDARAPYWSISTVHHDGLCAAQFLFPSNLTWNMSTALASLNTQEYPIVGNSNYTLAAWTKIQNAGLLQFTIMWWSADAGSGLGRSVAMEMLGTTNTDHDWELFSATVTAPSWADTFQIGFIAHAREAKDTLIYVDDISMIGQSPVAPTSTFYALRAVEKRTGRSSPLSEWVNPILNSSKVGAQSIEIDPTNSIIRSENFGASSDGNNTGFSSSPDGIDGNLLPSSKKATCWHDESMVLSGNALTVTPSTSQPYGTYSSQSSAANGNSFTKEIFLRPGWYSFNALGVAGTDRGKVDWYLDDVLLVPQQDWYAASTTYNAIKTAAVPVFVLYGGTHVLKAVVNGKNGSSSGYVIALTKFWLNAVSAPAGQLVFNLPQNSRNVILI